MIFFVSRNGTIIDTLPERVYQNSSKATTIYFVGDFSSTNALTVAFTLPDGTYTNERIMTEVDELNGFENFSVWAYTLPNNITAFSGSVGCQFKVYSAYPVIKDGASQTQSVVVATAYSSFVVEVGVPSIEELDPEQDIIDQIIAILGTKLDKKTHGGNITYIYGVTGTTQKQIPVDTTPTDSTHLITSGAVFDAKNDLQGQITILGGTLQDKAEYTYVDDKIDEEVERAENSYVKELYGYYENDGYFAFVRGENGNGENITSCILEFEPLVNELKNYTNTQIAQNTANFRGTWNTYNDIPTNTDLYPTDYSGNRVPTNSDYLVVINYTKDGQQGTWRFKYTGNWATQGKNGWHPEYRVNETPFTQEQLSAINSGITASKVDQITTNQTNIETLSDGVQDNAQAIQELDNSKLDKVSTTGSLRAYTVNSQGQQGTLGISSEPVANAIVRYTNDKRVKSEAPEENDDCVNKEYFEANKYPKLRYWE